MDTGAVRSCMNYDTYIELGDTTINWKAAPTVTGADGSDLGAMGTMKYMLILGNKKIEQEFIICKHLKRNVILGVDFAKRNCAGVSWTTEGTRVLTVGGNKVIEIAEDELGDVVTLKHTVNIPPRHGAICEVELNNIYETTRIISPNPKTLEENPMMFQSEIMLHPPEEDEQYMVYINIINLDPNKTLRLKNGNVIGFVHEERVDVTYIEVAKKWNHPDYEDTSPRNWVPRDTSGSPRWDHVNQLRIESCEPSQPSETKWTDIQEVVESDFLISPGDIYPNRKTNLDDAEISEETRQKFDRICEERHEAFSKNNKDIGRTQLIEMEIDTGDHIPVAQNPYTLPLKHYDWVRNEIETLEKAGVIERSLSPWASPVIVVPKKSAPDEPPRRRLCVDYRRVNSLQPEVEKGDKSKGCLSLYPLPKIDEMFGKLNGAKIFSTIDLRSGYYHIGLTQESRAKSAFVVPMGKWEFKRTPFGLSQAPACFQLLINKVLMDCGHFAMGYLDDIIIYSKTEEEHLKHIEQIFRRLEHFGLKMKREKCSFFKQHIQYLGHIISEEGFKPLPEKLESIRKMPAPRNAKEVKQFLGLIGYYRKFVPRFADISRPLTCLTRHDTTFTWTEKCEKSFNNLRILLMQDPILKYPDPEQPYVLFTDASKIGWSGVLTQHYAERDARPRYHPVCYVSGLFRGSQLNWAALTKEAYAIYMSIKKLTFYVTESNLTVRSDHLPLKKFLEKQTMNAKVNNWAVELEQFKVKLEWIQGTKNTLADSLSRLLEMTPEAKLEPEPEGQEFGTVCFEELPAAETHSVMLEQIDILEVQTPVESGQEIKLPLKREQMIRLQKSDSECRDIMKKLKKEQQTRKIYVNEEGLLIRLWTDGDVTHKCTVVPKVLRDPLLILCHNRNGHNGYRRSYMALKRNYYWPNMKKEVTLHCKNCEDCILQNQANTDMPFGHFTAPEGPMQFICMDLVGPITPVTSRGNRFCLTVIDMLTGYTIAAAIPDKTAETICKTYVEKVYSIFGGSSRMLTDNGTEFKNKIMDEVCKKLGIKRIYSPVYTPQSNGKLEGYHRFFKACIAKQIRGSDLEWDEIVPMASAAYNFFPCQASKESPFVLMFGRDPITPFASLLEPTPRYWGDRGSHLQMDALQRLYMLTTENLRRAREHSKDPEPVKEKLKFTVGDLVLVRDVNSRVFEPRYTPNFRVVAIYGNNHIAVKDEAGKITVRKAGHIKHVEPRDKAVEQLPAVEVFNKFGRAAKLLIHPKDVPVVKFPEIVSESCEPSQPSEQTETTDVKELQIDICNVNVSESRMTDVRTTPCHRCTIGPKTKTDVTADAPWTPLTTTMNPDVTLAVEQVTSTTTTGEIEMGSILKPLTNSLWFLMGCKSTVQTDHPLVHSDRGPNQHSFSIDL